MALLINLSALGFRAEANPQGPAIDLVWDLPYPAQPLDDTAMLIRRRQRRFPGRSRRGFFTVQASAEDLADGLPVYDSAACEYDFEETREDRQDDRVISTTRQYLYRGSPPDRQLVRAVRRELNAKDGTPIRTTIRVTDRSGLDAGTIYYYTAFVGQTRLFSRLTQASALATGRNGGAFFSALPQIHQRLDTTPPPAFSVPVADQNKGQLQRLVETFEAHADLFRGLIDGLGDLHARRRVDSRWLAPMARYIGWRLKDYLNEVEQRTEIGFAPEFYRTVGTIPNIAAMINRLTGWDARVREFVRNVAVSFDAARLEDIEATTAYLDGSQKPDPNLPDTLLSRARPVGSVNTADPNAMFKLRTRASDDPNAYSYDCGRSDYMGGYVLSNEVLYNRQTIGIYIVPDVESEPFDLLEEWTRVRQILIEFLPIQVRAIFILQPDLVVEEAYNATAMVVEGAFDNGLLLEDDAYAEGTDLVEDIIPEWSFMMSNDLASLTVNTAALPVDTHSRIWHVGLIPWS